MVVELEIYFYLPSGYRFRNAADTEDIVKFDENGPVEIYHDNSKKFETTGAGVIVTGIATATSFVKSGGTSSQYLMADGSVTTSGGGGVTVQDEGSSLSTTATTLNFVGSGVVASGTGATKTITIAGGASQDVFRTIAVSGQSDVVADSATDTLTLLLVVI